MIITTNKGRRRLMLSDKTICKLIKRALECMGFQDVEVKNESL